MNESVVIIGSGLGGLECGYLLAKKGKKVTILEKEPHIGGSLQTFLRKGSDGRLHSFDTGFHYVGGLQKGEPLNSLFKYFGLLDLPWKQLDPECFDEVSFENADGNGVSSYPHASGHIHFAERLTEFFPENADELMLYSEVLKKIGDRMFDEFHPASDMFRLFERSAYSFLNDTISSPRLRDVVCGSTTKMELNADTLPVFVFIQATNSFIDSAWRLGYDKEKKLGGGALIVRKLSDDIQAMGGAILTNHKVSAIHVSEDGSVSSVETTNGEKFTADWVISDAHPAVTMGLVDECKAVKKVYRHRIAGLKNTFGAFTANIILKPNTLQYLNRNLFVHRYGTDLWHMDRTRTESVMVHYYPPENGGKYAECIDIISPMDWEGICRWENLRPCGRGEEYEALKRKKLDECLDLLEKRLPGIRNCIDTVYTSTPLTWQSYTSTPQGTAYGVVKDYNNPLTTFLSPKTPLKNLLLTGQSLNLHGILGVSKTSVITCGAILGMETLQKEILG